AVVVGPRHADLSGDRVAVVANARVLDAATRLGVAEIVAGVAYGALQHDAVGVAAAAANEKAHGVHERERSAGDRRQRLALGHVLPVAHVTTPDLPVFVQDRCVNPGVLLVAVLVLRRHVPILTSLPRRPPLVAGAPAQRLGNQLVPLVGEQ